MKFKNKYTHILLFILSTSFIMVITFNSDKTYPKTEVTLFSDSENVLKENYNLETKSDSKYSDYTAVKAVLSDYLDWGVDDINAEHIWGNVEDATDIDEENVYTGNGIVIAFIDTGILKNYGNVHDEFIGKIVDEISILNQQIGSDATDGLGHGTHCAGIASASDNDFGIIGVAPESDLLIAKALTDEGFILNMDDIADAIDWAVNAGADIISMSIRTGGDYQTIHDAIINAYQAGVVMVAAAGNMNVDELEYPARYPEVISVGAIDWNHERSLWQNGQGSNYDELLDVVAPGSQIYSASTDNGYYTTGGTSQATPHVSGLCALMLEAQPLLSPSQVKDILRITATDLGNPGKDDEYGYGEVNAIKAVDAADLYFTDTDGDDITDTYEKYVYGTNLDEPDTDGDGLNDYHEIFTSLTDPTNADVDGDSLPDGWEIQYGLNPFIDDSQNDLDSDGLTNVQEYNLGTNPNNSDSDSDGMPDGWEITQNFNPLYFTDSTADADGDGLTNLEEYIEGTNPHLSDTDEDGYGDGYEIDPNLPYDSSDPTDPNSIPSVGGGGGGGFF